MKFLKLFGLDTLTFLLSSYFCSITTGGPTLSYRFEYFSIGDCCPTQSGLAWVTRTECSSIFGVTYGCNQSGNFMNIMNGVELYRQSGNCNII